MIILRNNSHGEIVRKALPMYVVNWLDNWKRWQVSNIRLDGIIFSKETGDTHWTTNCLRQLFVYPLVLFYWDWKKDTCVWARFLTGDTHCSCMMWAFIFRKQDVWCQRQSSLGFESCRWYVGYLGESCRRVWHEKNLERIWYYLLPADNEGPVFMEKRSRVIEAFTDFVTLLKEREKNREYSDSDWQCHLCRVDLM